MQVIAAKQEVHPNQVGIWKRQAIERLDEVFARGGSPGPSEHEATIRDLHREDRRVDDGTGFFSAGVAALSRPARRNLVDRDGALSIRRQCALAGHQPLIGVLRAAGRERGELGFDAADGRLVAPLPYGSRQMARHLRREGVAAGRRRVRHLMGLEATYRKRRTSDAQPDHQRLPVPAARTEDRPSGPDVVRGHHVHPGDDRLSVPGRDHGLGSRHVLSWRPSNTTDSSFCVEALAALQTGTPGIFNTDRGSQFTSAAFTDRVQAAGARCSIDGRGRCLDNVFIEQLWRSLKYETVYLHELADGFVAEQVISEWMTFYSDAHPHSALDGCTPAEAYREARAA